MILPAFLAGLAVARRWGLGWGVVAAYALYVVFSLSSWAGAALTAALIVLARGVYWDKVLGLGLLASIAKFVAVPLALGKVVPYYEALWYAMGASPAWRTYAPLTYLPGLPPLQLAVEGTLFVVLATALASRALAEVWGRRAVLWPLLATEPLYFGHWNAALPLVWAAAYFAARRSYAGVIASALLAAGFHIYGGLMALLVAALLGVWQALLLAPLALALPQSWILFTLAHGALSSITAAPVAGLERLLYWAPYWLAKIAAEGAVLLAAIAYAGRLAVIPLLGTAAGFALAAGRPDFGGYAYKHFLLVLPFSAARMDKKLLWALAAASLFPFLVAVHFFGLSWSWAVYYASTGNLSTGPIPESYRMIYGYS
ncbi:hypothetical protein [Pyrobaculum sp.]|uniref:hypothetical protein n=1 Tax=Pyrobaculum sp. TaxID=2004705 RepID=UPI00315FB940